MRLKSLASAIVVLSATLAARADQLFTFNNATFATGGALTGTFTTNNALTAITSFDIKASASGSFAGFEYTNSNSAVSASTLPSQYFRIDSTNSINELQIYFSSSLKASGTLINSANSYDHEPSGGNRSISGAIVGATATTPEPSGLALLGTGVLGVAGMVRRRMVR